MENTKLILASASPRRKEILSKLECDFEVRVSDCEEIVRGADPAEITKELSLQKAEAVALSCGEERCIVIGADTVVSIDRKILGKPADEAEARKMLELLQGRTHQVVTGVSIIGRTKIDMKVKSFAVSTDVIVASMSEEEIEGYIQTEEPYDKAGGYGIQGAFSKFVVGIQGDYNNVVGLPIQKLYEELKKVSLKG